jgi:superoxide oxidase
METTLTRRSTTILRDSGLRFSPVTIVLHWVVALLVMAIAIIEVIPAATYNADVVRLENLLGVILFLVSIYRLWARITSWHPLPVGTPNPVEVIVSRSVAIGMALAMVLLPIAVWLWKSAAGIPVDLPGGYAVPRLMAPNMQVASLVHVLFDIGASAFLIGLALHIFGAIKNQFLLKNDVLKRMLGKHVEL